MLILSIIITLDDTKYGVTMADKDYDSVLNEFKQAGASMRCARVKKLLESLGFTVRDGGNGNHKIFGHSGISTFTTSNYDCGHGSNSEVKPIYIKKNIIKILEAFEDEIKGFLIKDEGQ